MPPERSLTSILVPPPQTSFQFISEQQNEVQKEEASLQVLQEKPPWRIHPEGRFKSGWDIFMLLLVYYVSLVAPMNLAFFSAYQKTPSILQPYQEWLSKACQNGEDINEVGIAVPNLEYHIFLTKTSAVYEAFDIAVDVMFWLDLGMTFFVGYKPNRSLLIEYDLKKIAKKYMRQWFLLDFVAALPIDRIVDATVQSGSVQLQIVKLIRLLRLSRLLKRIGELMSSKQLRIVYLLILYTTIAHWIGCAFFFSARWQVENLNSGGANAFTGEPWIITQCLQFADFRTQYCVSLYWAFTTMTTVGYGDILPTTNIDRNMTSIVMVLGGIIQAIIFGNVAILIQTMDEARKRLQSKLDAVQEFLAFNDVPEILTAKAMDAIEYSWNYSQGVDDGSALSTLPGILQTDLMIQSREEIMTVFEDLGDGFQRAIVSRFHMNIFVPDDYVIHAGDTGSEMYIIKDGECHVLSQHETVTFAVLSSGDFFGDIDMILRTRRMATVKTKSYCTLFVLKREDLDEVLDQFPGHRELLIDKTRRRRDHLTEMNASFSIQSKQERTDQDTGEAVTVWPCPLYRSTSMIPSPPGELPSLREASHSVNRLIDRASRIRRRLQQQPSDQEWKETPYTFTHPVFSPASDDVE